MIGVDGWQEVPMGQTLLHAPQFPESRRFVQVPPQSVKPSSHTHRLFWQTLPPVQTLPAQRSGPSFASGSGMQAFSRPFSQHRLPFFPPTLHGAQSPSLQPCAAASETISDKLKKSVDVSKIADFI
jgi:hypothetical protein